MQRCPVFNRWRAAGLRDRSVQSRSLASAPKWADTAGGRIVTVLPRAPKQTGDGQESLRFCVLPPAVTVMTEEGHHPPHILASSRVDCRRWPDSISHSSQVGRRPPPHNSLHYAASGSVRQTTDARHRPADIRSQAFLQVRRCQPNKRCVAKRSVFMTVRIRTTARERPNCVCKKHCGTNKNYGKLTGNMFGVTRGRTKPGRLGY